MIRTLNIACEYYMLMDKHNLTIEVNKVLLAVAKHHYTKSSLAYIVGIDPKRIVTNFSPLDEVDQHFMDYCTIRSLPMSVKTVTMWMMEYGADMDAIEDLVIPFTVFVKGYIQADPDHVDLDELYRVWLSNKKWGL